MRKFTIAIAIAVIAATVSIIGIGYALGYTGTYISEDNTIETDQYLVEVCDNNSEPLEEGIQFNSPRYYIHDDGTDKVLHIDETEAELNSYTLHVECPGDSLMVSCMVLFKDARSWAVVESIGIYIGDTDSSDPSNWIYLTNGVSEHPVQVLKGYQPLTVQIVYRSMDISLKSTEDVGFMDLTKARLLFVAAEDAPLNAFVLSYGGDGFSVHLGSAAGPAHVSGSSVTEGMEVYIVPDEGKTISVSGIEATQSGGSYHFIMPGEALTLSVVATDV